MSKTSTAKVGRAAFNLKHLRRDRCGGDTTRGDRKSLLRECMRELDQRDLMHQAAMNSNIVVADAHLNVPFVNNGNGTFRRATSVEEVLDYQDARMDGVRVQKNSFETSLFVVHLPKSMCKEVPDFYTSTVDGREVKRARLVARDYDEAKQYLEESMRWLAENFIPGGIDAVAGGDMNFDESTPHIQFQADTFSPDPKDPAKLRCRPGIAYNTDESVRYKSGPKKGKQISGNQKFIDAQRGLREHMYALGYPVELDVSERHDESLSPDRYAEQQDRERDLANREGEVEVKRRSAQRDVDAAATDRKQAAQELQQAQQAKEAAQRVQESAEQQAREVAERVLKETREKAEQEAEKIRSEARKGAEQELGLAEAQADELLERAEETARSKASEITATARSEAETITREADETRKQAERDAEAIRDEARTQVEAIRKQREEEEALLQQTRDFYQEDKSLLRELSDEVDAKYEELKQVRQEVEEAKDFRDSMKQLDSDFLDEIRKDPKVNEQYEDFKQDRVRGFEAVADGTKDYYERTVGENRERREQRLRAERHLQQQNKQNEEERRKKGGKPIN